MNGCIVYSGKTMEDKHVTEVEVMDVLDQCPQCGSERLRTVKNYTFRKPANIEKKQIENLEIQYELERLWIFFEYVRRDGDEAAIGVSLCEGCGFIFLNPRFTEEEMRAQYVAVSEMRIPERRQKSMPPLRHEERSRRIYELVNGYHPVGESVSVLDYGGMQGYNLSVFVEKGCDCYLADYLEEVDHLEGVTYLGRDVADLKGATFDIILLCHVLEHVINPVEMVKDLRPFLKADGIIYAEVPLGCRNEWMKLSEPMTHINFFSEESLYHCFRLAGLGVTHLSTATQWVTRGEMDCLNIIAGKQVAEGETRYKTTPEQIEHYYHFKRKWRRSPVRQSLVFMKKLLTGKLGTLKDINV